MMSINISGDLQPLEFEISFEQTSASLPSLVLLHCWSCLAFVLPPFLGQKKKETQKDTRIPCVFFGLLCQALYIFASVLSILPLCGIVRTAKKIIVNRNMNIIPFSVRVCKLNGLILN
jgi:hypothetical protein